MSTQSIQQSYPIFNDIDGQPLEGGNIYIGTAGLAAQTNQIPVYWDEALTIPATQPIRTTGGYPMNGGSPGVIYTGVDDFSLAVNNKNNSAVTSSLNMTQRNSSSVVNPRFSYSVWVDDFGAVGDGVTDDSTAIQAAIDSIPSGQFGEINFSQGKTYAVATAISNNLRLITINGNTATINATANMGNVLSIAGSQCTVDNLVISKTGGITANGIYVNGSHHRFTRIYGSESAWPEFFSLQAARDCSFDQIRIDNDVSGRTGIIFNFDYSVNISVTNSAFGYCATGVYFTSNVNPSDSSKSEGITFSDCFPVYCDRAFYAENVTALMINNCIISFSLTFGVFVNNGHTLTVNNCYIDSAPESTSGFIAVGSLATNWDFSCVTNCVLVGNAGGGVGSAFSMGGLRNKIIGNHVREFDAGVINGTESYAYANTTNGVGSGFIGTANFAPAYELGTWVPTVTSTGGTITALTASGRYTRNGRKYSCDIRIVITTVGSGTGNLNVSLPVAAANIAPIQAVGIFREVVATGDTGPITVTNDGTANAILYPISAIATNHDFKISLEFEA